MNLNDENKVWVTVTTTLSIGEYQSVKVESGLSQTIGKNENPMDLLAELQNEVGDSVTDAALKLRKQFKNKIKNELRNRRDD